jgi:hypothetical protein
MAAAIPEADTLNLENTQCTVRIITSLHYS